jgi:hypothetical protein
LQSGDELVISDDDWSAAVAWMQRVNAASNLEQEFDSLIPSQLTEGIAHAVHSMAANQFTAGEYTSSSGVAAVAVSAFERLGMKAESLQAQFTMLLSRFMETEEPQEYRLLRADFERLALQARRTGQYEVAGRAAGRAGDCAFFAARAEDGDPRHPLDLKDHRVALLRTAMADATWALQQYAVPRAPTDLQLVSLVIGILRELTGPKITDSPEYEELESARRRLAAALEQAVQPGFEIPEQPQQSRWFHLELAKLLYEYGSADVAWKFAVRALDDDVTADFHLGAVADLYAAASESIDPAVDLGPLRQRGRLRAEEYRESFRSRAGRLWAGDDLERWLGKALRDDLLLATWGEQSSAADSTLVAEGERLKSRVLLDHLGGTLDREPSSPEARRTVHDLEVSVLQLKRPTGLDPRLAKSFGSTADWRRSVATIASYASRVSNRPKRCWRALKLEFAAEPLWPPPNR